MTRYVTVQFLALAVLSKLIVFILRGARAAPNYELAQVWSVAEAALLLGAFREAAHKHTTLPVLAAGLEQSGGRYLADFEPEEEAGERFVTMLEIPDDVRSAE
ncbi:hypothetical protein [Streptomyces sp. NPDC050355]|uniref:hypothetical protein n=1 Tax=Streptomyces sp. NPDC050355 TaxID=3365609 RepID=UPI003787D577